MDPSPHTICRGVDRRVAANLRRLRIAAGLSQTEVADALGVSFQLVQKWEHARTRVSAGRLAQLAALFGVPVAELFAEMGETEEPVDADGRAASARLELVRAFDRLPGRRVRAAALGLIRALAQERTP